jgi:hypothetical protein
MERCRIALEVGTHPPWVSRLLKSAAGEADQQEQPQE